MGFKVQYLFYKSSLVDIFVFSFPLKSADATLQGYNFSTSATILATPYKIFYPDKAAISNIFQRLRGFSHFNSRNRAKSESVEQRKRPCSIARAAR